MGNCCVGTLHIWRAAQGLLAPLEEVAARMGEMQRQKKSTRLPSIPESRILVEDADLPFSSGRRFFMSVIYLEYLLRYLCIQHSIAQDFDTKHIIKLVLSIFEREIQEGKEDSVNRSRSLIQEQ